MARKFKLQRITGGLDDGHVGIFSGDVQVGLVEPASFRETVLAVKNKGGACALDKTEDELARRKIPVDAAARVLTATSGLRDRLADRVGARMVEHRCDYPTALREVTAQSPELWIEHQTQHRTIMPE